MDTMAKIAERKIAESLERGELEEIPGQGEPLDLEDDRLVPEDLRMVHRILKNAGYTPPEITAQRELVRTEQLLEGMTDEKEKLTAIKRLNLMLTKLGEQRGFATGLEEQWRYYSRIVAKVQRGS